jgi:hypothetical protein
VGCGKVDTMKRIGVVFCAALAALACAGVAGGRPRAVAALYLTPAGNDAADCTLAAPCSTLQRAFTLAAPGDTVQLAPGTYPGQQLSGDRGGLVTFAAAPGARVTMGGRLTIAGASHVKLVNFDFPRSDPQYELFFDACNTDVTLDNSTGRRFLIIEGNSHITFDGGYWGGYSTPGDEDSAIGTGGSDGPDRQCNGAIAPPAHDIVFDRFTWHDVYWGKTVAEWGGAHPDCFEINGYADGITIRNSSFIRCQDSFLAIYPEQGDVTNVTVQNTLFLGLGNTTWYGSQWESDDFTHFCGNVLFQGNLWLPNNPGAHYPFSSIRAFCTPPPGAGPVQIVGNIFQAPPVPEDCAREIAPPYNTVWRNNIFLLAGPSRPPCKS